MPKKHKTGNKKIIIFRKLIFKWSKENFRNFPWRKQGISKYDILIAEIMLQKTKAENVVYIYKKFLEKYPTPSKLSKARQKSIEKLIKPLGLYRNRSQNLLILGKAIVPPNDIPHSYANLSVLPGIGPYITNAFLISAYDQSLPVVDTNIRRLYERIFSIKSKVDPRRDRDIWMFAKKILPKKNCRSFTWGLLDFSALVCKKRKPNCHVCPLQTICNFYNISKL